MSTEGGAWPRLIPHCLMWPVDWPAWPCGGPSWHATVAPRSETEQCSVLQPVVPFLALLLSAPALATAADSVGGPTRMVDAETLIVAGQRVRLLGSDAPDRKPACRRAGTPEPCGNRQPRRCVSRSGRTRWSARCTLRTATVGHWASVGMPGGRPERLAGGPGLGAGLPALLHHLCSAGRPSAGGHLGGGICPAVGLATRRPAQLIANEGGVRKPL